MSRITELANAEADEAEAEDEETPEPLEGDEPTETGDRPAEPGEPSTEAQIRQLGKRLDAEEERHRKRLAELLGEQFDHYLVCPLCQVSGYVLPYEPGQIEQAQRAAIAAAAGEGAPAAYVASPDHEGCPRCDAKGLLLTGSQVPDQVTKLCDLCDGSGYVTHALAESQREPIAVGNGNGAAQAPALDLSQPRDAWGRAFGHPHYGWDPAAVGV